MFERIMGIHVINEPECQRYRERMEPILTAVGGAFGYDFTVKKVLRSKTDNTINRVFTLEFPAKSVMDDFFLREDYQAVQKTHFNKAIKSKTVISMHEKKY